MVFYFSGISSLLIAAAIGLLIIANISYQRRAFPGAHPFSFLALSVAFWAGVVGLEYAVQGIENKILFSKFEYIGITSLLPFWVIFSLEFSLQKKIKAVKHLSLLWIMPIITVLFAWTNESHGLIWRSITLSPGSIGLSYIHGIWFWVWSVYSYLMLGLGSFFLIQAIVRHPEIYRQQITPVLIAVSLPWLANFIYITGNSPLTDIDPTPLAFAASAISIAVGFYRVRLFELTPMAQNVLFSTMQDSVIVLDNSMHIVSANPAACKLFGIDEQDNLPGMTAHNDWELIQNSIETHKSHLPYREEFWLGPQSLNCYDVSFQALQNKGDEKGFLLVFREITERKLNEIRLNKMLDAFPDALLLLSPNGTIKYANQKAIQLFADPGEVDSQRDIPNQKISHLSGQSIEAVIPERFSDHPLRPQVYLEAVNEHNRSTSVSALVRRRDGSEFPIEISFNSLETSEGLQVLASFRDISARLQTEEQLRIQSVALEAAASGVLISNREGKIIWVNPAFTEITGYPAEEAIGQSTNLLRSGKHEPSFYKDLWETILEGKIWHGQLINKRKDGSLYTEEQTIAPVRNNDGEITHFIAIKQNITDRVALSQLRDDLMHVLVHDLRSPLAVIMASLEILPIISGLNTLTAEARELLAISQSSTQRMLTMVNAILDTEKLESRSWVLQREAVSLANLAEQACRLQGPLSQRNEIMLLNDIPFNLPPVYVDSSLVLRIFQNLLDNAIKYTPAGKNIELNASLLSDLEFVKVTVRDHGPGITSEIRERLFEKYVSDPQKRRGTGLGLVFCRMAVEAHGGQIWAENAEDGGTLFSFTIPTQTSMTQG